MKHLILTFLLINHFLWSQNQVKSSDSIPRSYIIVGDTITNTSINLSEVVILPKMKFDDSKDRLSYLILQRKTIKVYPYAKLAAERLIKLNYRLSNIKSKYKRKKYTKNVQKFIENEFGDNFKQQLIKNSKKHLMNKSLILDKDFLKISKKGKFLCDGIASDLFII